MVDWMCVREVRYRVLDREMTKIKTQAHPGATANRLGTWCFRISSCSTTVPSGPIWISYSKRTGWKKKKGTERAHAFHEVLEQVGMTAKADQMPWRVVGWRTAMRVYRKSHPEPSGRLTPGRRSVPEISTKRTVVGPPQYCTTSAKRVPPSC